MCAHWSSFAGDEKMLVGASYISGSNANIITHAPMLTLIFSTLITSPSAFSGNNIFSDKNLQTIRRADMFSCNPMKSFFCCSWSSFFDCSFVFKGESRRNFFYFKIFKKWFANYSDRRKPLSIAINGLFIPASLMHLSRFHARIQVVLNLFNVELKPIRDGRRFSII